jgi:flagellar basal-body rod protein FlgB
MAVSDLPLFSVLKNRMRWLEERQKVLAENIANANTPHYRAHDLKQLDFKSTLDASMPGPIRLAATQPGHIAGAAADAASFPQGPQGGFETKPSGNAVVLEEEMMKVAQTQIDHPTAISLYKRGLGMIKIALGKSA